MEAQHVAGQFGGRGADIREVSRDHHEYEPPIHTPQYRATSLPIFAVSLPPEYRGQGLSGRVSLRGYRCHGDGAAICEGGAVETFETNVLLNGWRSACYRF